MSGSRSMTESERRFHSAGLMSHRSDAYLPVIFLLAQLSRLEE